MQIVEQYLIQMVYFFQTNYIAAGILAVVIIVSAIKKPKELFKTVALLALMVGVLYVMIYIEKSMFSGVASKERGIDIESKLK